VRFPEDKIKNAILHPHAEIRDRATRYFANSSSPDPSIMPRVVAAVEKYGRDGAYHLIGTSRTLPQTEVTISWVIKELNDELSDRYENYTYNLCMVLAEADTDLLLHRESEVLEASHRPLDLRPQIAERLRMREWDEATCWRELEELCDHAKEKQDVNQVNLNRAYRIVEALARFGQTCEPKVRALLEQKGDYDTPSLMTWMEPCLARLAGELRLESTVPLLITKLRNNGDDVLNPECARALTRIGTPAVIEAVARAFPTSKVQFRNYGTEPLEHIHTDFAVETCLLLLEQESSPWIRQNLAHALLSQFAYQGIEAARRLCLASDLDFEGKGLRAFLIETCIVMGERFPELDEWSAADESERAEHRRAVDALKDDPTRLLCYLLEKITGKSSAQALEGVPKPPTRPPVAPPNRWLPEPIRAGVRHRVGRNARCPCGSGKKFKVCCGQT
jgi:hypothetical protein